VAVGDPVEGDGPEKRDDLPPEGFRVVPRGPDRPLELGLSLDEPLITVLMVSHQEHLAGLGGSEPLKRGVQEQERGIASVKVSPIVPPVVVARTVHLIVT